LIESDERWLSIEQQQWLFTNLGAALSHARGSRKQIEADQ